MDRSIGPEPSKVSVWPFLKKILRNRPPTPYQDGTYRVPVSLAEFFPVQFFAWNLGKRRPWSLAALLSDLPFVRQPGVVPFLKRAQRGSWWREWTLPKGSLSAGDDRPQASR